MKSLVPSLALRAQTALVLAPQVQQALHLLTLPAVELRQAIDEALLNNPFLVLEEDLAENSEKSPASAENSFASHAPDADEQTLIWEPFGRGGLEDEPEADPFARIALPEDLRSVLYEQARGLLIPEAVRDHLLLLIEALDEDGYLTASLEEIATWCTPAADREYLEEALRQLQRLEPTGVGARSLQECLLLQLAELAPHPSEKLAAAIIENHLELLARHDYAQLMKRLGCSSAELQAAIDLILTLDPKPGRRYAASSSEAVIPDLLVQPDEGDRWRVVLNPVAYPKVVVSPLYERHLTRKSPEQWRNWLAEARQFVKQLQQRALTLMRAAQVIVDHQRDFFRFGRVALKPLTRKEVAEALEVHESTVSRIVAHKYLASPRGVVALESFFSARLATERGEALSAAAIQERIQALIEAEDPHAPLSDQEITEKLQQEGIEIARRTVAKYRDLLKIPSAKYRKRL